MNIPDDMTIIRYGLGIVVRLYVAVRVFWWSGHIATLPRHTSKRRFVSLSIGSVSMLRSLEIGFSSSMFSLASWYETQR